MAYVHGHANGSGKPRILRYGYRALEGGAAPVERAVKDLHPEQFQCVTLLHSGEFQLLQIEAPTVPASELRSATRWRIKDMVDYHIDDATIDLLDIPLPESEAGRSHSMFAVSARNEVIEACIRKFETAKIPLAAIDIPETAQRNIGTLYEEGERGVAVLYVEENTALLTVNYREELYLSRRVDLGLSDLRAVESRTETINRLTLELQRTFDHFDRQFRFATTARLMVAPLPEEVGVAESLARDLGMPVTQIDLTEVLAFDANGAGAAPDAAIQWRLFHLFGTSMRHEAKVL